MLDNPNANNKQQSDINNQINSPAKQQWGDFDGTEHPFGEIPEGWTAVNKEPPSKSHNGKAKKNLNDVSQLNNDIPYAQFMANIVDGLDENLQKLLYEQANKVKDFKPSSNIDTFTTPSPKKTATVTDKQRETSQHLNSGSRSPDNGLLPDIYTLRRTVPGGEPKTPEVPKSAHNALDQVPPNSYLAQKITAKENGDPDSLDSSSSNSGSSDSDRSNKNKRKSHKRKEYKRRERIRIEEATKVKIDSPQPYDGSSDFDTFERWTYAVNAWFEITEFPHRHRVRHMLAFMRGQAQQFYMMFVAPDIRRWTVESVGQALFNYCFPPAFRRQMQMKFNDLSQGKWSVREYLRHLRSIAARLPDITEFQLIQKYWDGANHYLRFKWTENGYTPEFSTLDELELAAERFENAENLQLFETRKENKEPHEGNMNNYWHRGTQLTTHKPAFVRTTVGTKLQKYTNNRTGGRTNEASSLTLRKHDLPSTRGSYSARLNGRPCMTPEKRDKLRANNQCFICHQKGHLSRDCPTRTTVSHPPGIQTATINLDTMQSVDDATNAQLALQISVATIVGNHSHNTVDAQVQCNATSVKNHQMSKATSHLKTYPQLMNTLERNASKPKDFNQIVPKAFIVECQINGKPMKALLDSGSLSDFISTVTVDQLKLTASHLVKSIACQMAASGSQTMITSSVEADLTYQGINETQHFDVINLENHDIILGTPFLWQHKVVIGFNPAKIMIGSNVALQLEGEDIAHISSMTADIASTNLETLRDILRREALDLCKRAEDTSLPPLRIINHRLLIIDNDKRYTFRPSRCPEVLRSLWIEKRDKYLKSGRWERHVGGNAIPMLLLHKKPGPDGVPRLRTVLDPWEQNLNTKKMASPLPDQQEILMNVCRHRYRTLIDGKDAYESIRIAPDDVDNMLFNTPDGTMVSHVMQQGNCNAPATYQTLMNHVLSDYIGKFVEAYLDDIIVFLDTLEAHIEHVRIVLEILRKNKLYLSTPDKLQLFATDLHILGHRIDSKGIRMDPNKVDQIIHWKTLTNRNLLLQFWCCGLPGRQLPKSSP